MASFKSDKKYQWSFQNIGGTTRVKISSGEDIRHLGELDKKMWTVLSCPVKGLEIDEKSLACMDVDGDGKIHVDDVIKTAQWVTGLLKDADILLEGKGVVSLDVINTENEAGKKLYNSAKCVLANLDKEAKEISLEDTADSAAVFAKTLFNGDGVITEASVAGDDEKAVLTSIMTTVGSVQDRSGVPGVNAELIETFYKAVADYIAWCDAAVEPPYGDKTDAVIEAYTSLDAKVKDFFMRSRLAEFTPSSMETLDVQASQIASISAENLTFKTDEIASYPLARITGKAEIDLSAPVNPAWAAKFDVIRSVIGADQKTLTEESWSAVGAAFMPYTAWLGAKAGACVESLGIETIRSINEKNIKDALLEVVAKDAALKEESDNIEMVNKFLYVVRDFYRLLRNFVTLQDFYERDKRVTAVFQIGRLIIDQRECRMCMNVADMAKHTAMAAKSGMYLVYCDCVTKTKPGVLKICAAITVGEIGDLIVGKNAIFYDNNGLDWDAVVTKIVENPISIGEAFWSPYRRMSKAIENLINKSAADKDAKMMAEANAKIAAAPTAVPAAGTVPAKPAAAPPFDIGKFAGIFAALGMALGMIGTALVQLTKGIVALKWWQIIILFVGIMLLISGPSMVMAWMKLRRRNVAPLLNANGWAVNAASRISIQFGETLTDVAKFPKLKLKDPYAKKGMPAWAKWLITIVFIAAVAAGFLLLKNMFHF